MSVSDRAKKMKPFLAMELLEKVQAAQAEGRDVISLALGEPDFDAPECVKKSIGAAIAANETKYTHSQGLMGLREEICRHYYERYKVEISPERVIVTSGTSPALVLIFGALLDAGEEFILPDPHYPCYPSFVQFLNGQPVYVPVAEADGFQYRPEEVKKRVTNQTKGIMLTSPANPTGTIMDADTMEQMAELVGAPLAAPDKGPYIVSDEIYHGLVYEPIAPGDAGHIFANETSASEPKIVSQRQDPATRCEHSILEFTDRAFVINGFSKAYAMTGFRLGYCIVPEDFVRPMQIMQQNLFISANSFVQQAGITALRDAGPDVERMRQEFDRRRRLVLTRLQEMGFRIAVEPLGAFYVFANAKHLTQDSFQFCMDLFDATGVAVTPGIDFGPGGEGYLRFSYANSLETIQEALNRIAAYLKAT